MDKCSKSQILKVSLIAALLAVTPLLSTSLRPTYLYFIFNLLIIALGADAGLLSFFSKAAQERKSPSVVTPKAPLLNSEAAFDNDGYRWDTNGSARPEEGNQKRAKTVEKCSTEKVLGTIRTRLLRKSPSTPSLFFIGGGAETETAEETVAQEVYEEEEEEQFGEPSGQELFHKAETFIGNFYKQLKMQREDSLNKIHDFISKPFTQ